MPVASRTPDGVRPFKFHGIHLREVGGDQAAGGDCPFCGREGKLGCNVVTGLWDCKGCGAEGNVRQFLRQLWAESDKTTTGYDELIAARGLLYQETPIKWRVVRSCVTGEWLVPGYDHLGEMAQLYVYRKPVGGKKPILMPTPGCHSGLFGVPDGNGRVVAGDRANVYVCEGPWDAMALWEAMRGAKPLGADMVPTGSEQASVLAGASVVGVPGCNTFAEEWLPLFSGKSVRLMFDNDHPLPHPKTGALQPPAAAEGLRRVTGLLGRSRTPPTEVKYLRWGGEGEDYDAGLPHGHDVRDALTRLPDGTAADAQQRCDLLAGLLADVVLVPDSWGLPKPKPPGGKGKVEFLPEPCSSWKVLETAWRKALKWRQELADVLATMLAVCASTSQVGDQLFLQVIGDPGSGKTRFCDGLVVSKHCYPLEHLSGFHSGWKGTGDDEGQDFSLLARVNHTTMVTPEGDVMMSSPKFPELMSQQRRIFDGTSGASFKNMKEDRRYTGLRTPWIIAGTPALMASDQSRLGDRFLRICISRPSDEEREDIKARVFYQMTESIATVSNGDAEGTVNGRQAAAYRLTGGYVNHLRAEAPGLLARVVEGTDLAWLYRQVGPMADLVADLRARPDPSVYGKDSGREVDTGKELPSRLTAQLTRLALCLAVVLNRPRADKEVVRVVRKVAVDTARGKTMDLAAAMYESGDQGLASGRLANLCSLTEGKLGTLLRFLRGISVAESYSEVPTGRVYRVGPTRWRLTRRFRALYKAVVVAGGAV